MLKITNRNGVWVEGTYNGRFFQAKVYETASLYGINGGRVSKLFVCSTPEWDSTEIIIEYDRGFATELKSPGEEMRLRLAVEIAKALETELKGDKT